MSRRGRPPVHRRDALLDAAAGVLVTRGLTGLTHASAATAAGIATASMQHHFPTVAALRREALCHKVRTELERLMRSLDDVDDPWEQVRSIIVTSVGADEPTRRSGWLLWLEYHRAAATDPVIAEHAGLTDARWTTAVSAVIERGTAAGRFAPATSSHEAAEAILAAVDGYGIVLAAPHPDAVARRSIERLESLARLLLRPRP